MGNLNNDLVAIVLQHLNENKYHEAARSLEQESGIFFNVKHFEEKVIAGEWEDLEKYLLGFTKIDENRFSMKMFFDQRRQKYLEALDRNKKDRALEILRDDLKVFSLYDEDMYKELSHLLTLENFREHASLWNYVDAQTSRMKLVISFKGLIDANPNFRRRLDFPSFGSARLINMLNQSLNMQHSLCENWRETPEYKTLLTDHECKPANMASTSSAVPTAMVVNRNAFPSLGVDSYFQNSGASSSGKGAASLREPAVATATCMPFLSNQVSSLIPPRLPPATRRNVDHEYDRLMKFLRSALSPDEVVGSSVASAINVEDSDEENRHASTRSVTHVIGSSVAAVINVEDYDEENRHASTRSVTHCDDEPKVIINERSIPLDAVRGKNKPWQIPEITNLDQSSKLLYHSLTMQPGRKHANLRNYVDAQTSRIKLVISVKDLIEANPNFRRKLDCPSFGSARLNILNQSLNMQHSLCENRREIPEIETLFTDHECKSANMASTFSAVPAATIVNHNAFPSLGVVSCDDEPKAIINKRPIPLDAVQGKNKPWQLPEITNLDQSSKLPYHSLTMQPGRGDVVYYLTIAAHPQERNQFAIELTYR